MTNYWPPLRLYLQSFCLIQHIPWILLFLSYSFSLLQSYFPIIIYWMNFICLYVRCFFYFCINLFGFSLFQINRQMRGYRITGKWKRQKNAQATNHIQFITITTIKSTVSTNAVPSITRTCWIGGEFGINTNTSKFHCFVFSVHYRNTLSQFSSDYFFAFFSFVSILIYENFPKI